jgi:dTDP-4-amino-4,6-dideoxygalactose transaminase
MKQIIPLAKPYFEEEEVSDVRDTLKSGWVAEGPKVNQFEKDFANYCNAKYGIAVNSCTSALQISLLAYGIGPGDVVLIPDFTYTATGNVVLNVGATPRIIDIELKTFSIDIGTLEKSIDETVKAIIPVHPLGYPLNMEKINKIANKWDIKIIEDAALGIGSMIEGKKTGSFNNVTCFSLQGRKIITTGEGGMIVLNNEDLLEDLKALKSQGDYFVKSVKDKSINRHIFKRQGFSYRLSDIQAGIGCIQLKRIEEFINKRISLAKYYNDRFEDIGVDIIYPDPPKSVRYNYQTYAIMVKEKRDLIINELKKNYIESTIGTYSLSTQPLFKLRAHAHDNHNGKYAYNHTLALPMYYELTQAQIDYIVKKLKKIIIEN